jgi:hypothetical protein
MLCMCVYMHSRFIENHPIRILKDGPLISEVVLSQPPPELPAESASLRNPRMRRNTSGTSSSSDEPLSECLNTGITTAASEAWSSRRAARASRSRSNAVSVPTMLPARSSFRMKSHVMPSSPPPQHPEPAIGSGGSAVMSDSSRSRRLSHVVVRRNRADAEAGDNDDDAH